MRWKAAWTVTRDVVTFGLGVFTFLWEVLNKDHDPWLLGASLVLLGVPGAIALLVPGRGSLASTTTTEPGSSSQGLPSRPQP